MGERALTFGLVLGGIAPCLSGVLAASSPGTYVDSLGHTIPFIFTTDAYRFFKFWMRLQGGDAFVAGAARVAGALVGSTEMKRLLAVVGVLHSAFEIVLIPSDLLQWCSSTGRCELAAMTLAWGFMLVHCVLVTCFSYGLVTTKTQGKTRKAS